MAKPKVVIPEDKLDLYEKLIKSNPEIHFKGKR